MKDNLLKSVQVRVDFSKTDKYIFFPFLFLLLVGALMVLSTSTVGKDSGILNTRVLNHFLSICIGALFCWIAEKIPTETLQKNIYWFLIIIIILMILVLIPNVGHSVKGAKRWLKTPLGFQIQPSFFCKLVLIIFMASSLSRKSPEKLTSFKKGVFPYMVIIGILGLLFMGEPDFGGFFVVLTISLIMLIIGGSRFRYWFISMVLFLVPVLIYLATSQSYRVARLKAFLDIWQHQSGASYQIVQSLYSFAAGGLTGIGPGLGRQKLTFLPEAHTDFIFAVIGEELGFVGCLLVVMAFLIITCRGFYLSLKLSDKNNYLALLACGLTLFISLEAVINMLVNLSLAPAKGLPLPFVSYGGSAMICYMIAIGLLLNISRRIEE